jgi:hypothetical protein
MGIQPKKRPAAASSARAASHACPSTSPLPSGVPSTFNHPVIRLLLRVSSTPVTRGPLVIAVVVVAFLAVGGYLIFGRAGGGPAQKMTFDLAVTGTKMTPSQVSVHEGDSVTLRVTTDRKEEIHLHGYNVMFESNGPGDTVTHSFTADKTGDFDIEIEDSSTQVGTLTVSPR